MVEVEVLEVEAEAEVEVEVEVEEAVYAVVAVVREVVEAAATMEADVVNVEPHSNLN